MPAPKADGEPGLRPVGTDEMSTWAKWLLGLPQEDVARQLTPHSCKCSCLSYLSKWGATWEDRELLGGHCGMHTSVLTYSRDSVARPLMVLESMLSQIRNHEFSPDSSRSGRFAAKGKSTGSEKAGHLDLGVRAEAPLSSSVLHDRPDGELSPGTFNVGNDQARSEVKGELDGEPLWDLEEAEVISTTSAATTSSSSDEAGAVENPARRLALPPRAPERMKILQHQKTRMLHLMLEKNQRIFVCGRAIGVFHKPPGETRHDTPCCSGCWKQVR